MLPSTRVSNAPTALHILMLIWTHLQGAEVIYHKAIRPALHNNTYKPTVTADSTSTTTSSRID